MNLVSRYVFGLALSFGVCLAQSSGAECDPTPQPGTFQSQAVLSSTELRKIDSSDRSVLLDLRFGHSGEIQAVQVLNGAGVLRAQAIRAAVRRNYVKWIGYAGIFVEVKFPRGSMGRP